MLVIGRMFYPQGEQQRSAEWLRCELVEHYLGKEGREALFRADNGRPMLAVPRADISISHSHGMVMAALSIPDEYVAVQKPPLAEEIHVEIYQVSFARVGVDVELLTDGDCERYRKIAKRWFCADEQAYLEAIQPEAMYREAFFRMWTQKESICKLTGKGLSAIRTVNTLALPEEMTITSHLLTTQNGVYIYTFCGEAAHTGKSLPGM